ncbi:MAG: prolyl oligopeptidase family serine peptidase [Cyclobacteriaceae bacterium]
MSFKYSITFQNIINNKWAFIVLILLFACGGSEEPLPEEQEKHLVSSEKVGSINQFLLRIGISQFDLSELQNDLKYDVEIYKLEYSTEFLGEKIIASGLIGIPESEDAFPLLSFQHGTISSHEDAPSENPLGSFYSAFASLGYIAIVPDFIGFGSSSDYIHPYYHKESSAQCVVDMIRASKEFLEQENQAYEEKLFLAGYSEGGYVTMVTHQLIEEEYSSEFNLVASAPASGAYDIKQMQEYMFSLDIYNQPYYLAYVAHSYANIYGWTGFYSTIFNEPYASKILTLFNGTRSGSSINNELTIDMEELLTMNVLTGIDNNSEFGDFASALEINSPLNWIPSKPMYLYHGTSDDLIPYSNSADTYLNLIDAGTSPMTLSLTRLDGYNHGTGVTPYILGMLSDFEQLK